MNGWLGYIGCGCGDASESPHEKKFNANMMGAGGRDGHAFQYGANISKLLGAELPSHGVHFNALLLGTTG